ncbi:DUF4434 family protein, partial [Escherichia coli]|nr:DUF4434 family protein [Escherichia coli]
LCRMAAEEGIFFYEEHAYKSTDQSLVLCDTVRHLPESFEIPWNPNTRTEVSTLCISQFRYSAQIRPSSVVTKDYTFKRPGWAGRFEQEGQHQDYQRTQYEVYDYPGRFKSAHGQNFARWQMDGWRNNAETARGMSRSPEIWPGRRIVLTGHPQANLNREWQVVASELHGEQPQAVPGRQGAGTALENHFAVIPADRTWRPQPLLKPLVDGPQSAVVTGPAGEEIFCDEHGRVRVKFNWDRYNPADQDSSCWIRVAQAWAGTGFGHLAIPRVGQEVIVDFLNGDPDQPIIMGRTYHQENRTPGSLPGTKTQMTIRSKTYMGSGFNELKFDDATVREQVYIHAQKNMDTLVLQWTRYGDAFTQPEQRALLFKRAAAAQQAGLKLIVGLNADPEFFMHQKQSSAALESYLNRLLAADLQQARLWSAAPGVTPDGWYISAEIDDLNWRSEAARQPLLTWLNNEQRLISDVSAKPVYISSFFAGNMSPDGYRQLLEHVKATGVNVWVQDGSGVDKLTAEQRERYLQASADCQSSAPASGIVYELFVAGKGKTFTAKPKPDAEIASLLAKRSSCGKDTLYFSLRYLPVAHGILEY